MKIMIASDIHGSAYWCRKLLEAREREQPNKLLLLGDILYHGPRNPLPDEYAPAKVAEMLNAISKLKPQALKGTYMKSAALCSTMSHGVKVDLKAFLTGAEK